MKQLDVKHMHPVDQINLIIGKIYKGRLTTTSGGNISIIDEHGDIWITPSAIDKGSLTAKDIIQVKKDGTIIGPHKPSSEYPFHSAIYRARPELKAIIHAHPPALVAFSIARTIPDTKIVPEIYRICGDIGYADYDTPGTEGLGKKIAHEFIDKRHKAVIMENHGVVLGGTDLLDAYQRFETLEFCCRAIINAQLLGGAKYLTTNQIESNLENSSIKTSSSSYKEFEQSNHETELRTSIVKFIRRGCDQGLMMSAFGTVSCRLKNNDFLITPHNIARWDIETDDLVLIINGKNEEGKTPSRYTHLHQRIYELNPNVNAVISTLPANLMANAISGKRLDVRTIPESWIYLQDVPTIPFELQKEVDKLASTFNNKRVVLLENDSVLVAGDSLLNAFDYLEVAEFSANSLIAATSVGPLCPIGDKEIEDLRIAFNVK